jgi:putative oxidoreductase
MREAPFGGFEYRLDCRILQSGCALQRLFSTFPDRWPGLGLLLLRLNLGLRVIYIETLNLSGKPPEPTGLAQSLIALVGGILLLAGLWTPIIGTFLALDEVWIALSVLLSHPADIVIPVFLAVLSTSVAMLGPGAWSIDARLFGRRRVYHDRNRGKRSSS